MQPFKQRHTDILRLCRSNAEYEQCNWISRRYKHIDIIYYKRARNIETWSELDKILVRQNIHRKYDRRWGIETFPQLKVLSCLKF